MTLPRAVVIDTSVVVAGLLTSDPASPTARVVDAMLAGQIVFLLSEELLAEYRTVLLRPAIRERHGLRDPEVDALLTEIVHNGVVRAPETSSESAPDRGDQHLSDLARTEPGCAIVTGDRELLAEPPKEASVLSARELAGRLAS